MKPIKSTKSAIQLFASIAPLTAAVLAPLAVLLDIPALTEKWYTRNGEPQSDPRASLILSGLSLGFSLIANALLVVRFSLTGEGWRIATRVSVACWLVKVVTGITNLVVFGALTRNQPQFSYAEGFWSAVVSLIASGIILGLLLLHWAVQFQSKRYERKHPEKLSHRRLQIRVAGRHFMLQNTLLIALVALSSLIFSRIEDWTYLQGIYFTIVTFLTVGFGDFYPTKPSTKVLLFPLALVGITFLANSISMIVSFFRKHRDEHKRQARAEREKAWQLAQISTNNPSLDREIAFLSRLHERQGWREHANDLLRSLAGFLTFWLAGAAIFGAVEVSLGRMVMDCISATYSFYLLAMVILHQYRLLAEASRGQALWLYALLIGLIQVIFVIYSLMAVPIMAAFAVEAIQNVIEHISNQRMDKRRAEVGDDTSPDAPAESMGNDSESNPTKEEPIDKMHSTLILHYQPSTSESAQKEFSNVTIRKVDLEALMEHAVSLERTARRLLVAHLEEGSRAQILLRADWNLQSRDLRALELEMKGDSAPGGTSTTIVVPDGHSRQGLVINEAGITNQPNDKEEREEAEIAETAIEGMDEEETLEAVRDFRREVAGLLALGSHLRQLEGLEKYMFERRRKEAEGKTQ